MGIFSKRSRKQLGEPDDAKAPAAKAFAIGDHLMTLFVALLLPAVLVGGLALRAVNYPIEVLDTAVAKTLKLAEYEQELWTKGSQEDRAALVADNPPVSSESPTTQERPVAVFPPRDIPEKFQLKMLTEFYDLLDKKYPLLLRNSDFAGTLPLTMYNSDRKRGELVSLGYSFVAEGEGRIASYAVTVEEDDTFRLFDTSNSEKPVEILPLKTD